jgi:hypothetical protein
MRADVWRMCHLDPCIVDAATGSMVTGSKSRRQGGK